MTGIAALGAVGDLLSKFSVDQASAGTKASAGTGAASFADALAKVSSDTVDRLHHAEGISLQALQGDLPTREVVDAVMSAEQSLQTAIAIRDKIVTAYLEISRMAI